jgi:hypothetical protein
LITGFGDGAGSKQKAVKLPFEVTVNRVVTQAPAKQRFSSETCRSKPTRNIAGKKRVGQEGRGFQLSLWKRQNKARRLGLCKFDGPRAGLLLSGRATLSRKDWESITSSNGFLSKIDADLKELKKFRWQSRPVVTTEPASFRLMSASADSSVTISVRLNL